MHIEIVIWHRLEHVWEKLSDDEYLERIGAAKISKVDGKLHPTAAGLLMFGKEYKILYEFPEYFLDYREVLDPSIRWTDRLQSSSGDWTGNLFDFFFRVNSKLTKDLKVPFQLDGIVRVDDTPVHKAIREALANCIVNTDFYLPRGVVIRKDADSIIMENPGSIRTGKKQMLKGGISDPRNKALMKMLNLIGIGERAGSGVPDIYGVWEQQGWMEPEVEEQYAPDRTILKLSFLQKKSAQGGKYDTNLFSEQVSEQVSGQDDKHVSDHDYSFEDEMFLLQEFCTEPRTRQEMQDFLGISSRGYFLKKFISPMVNSGKLKFTIPDKPNSRNQRYIKG